MENITASYLVLRRYGTQEWVFKVHLTEQEQWKLIQFEKKCPCSTTVPCESVVRYDIPELT
jgi:uncharacterized OsmC-like protein